MSMRFTAMRIIRAVAACVVAVSTAVTVGCTRTDPTPQQAALAPSKNINVPVITVQKETEARQVKVGLEITVSPVTYAPKVVQSTKVTARERTVNEEMWGGRNMAMVPVTKTTVHVARVEPANLAFLVTINNKMPRVFHGAGTVVQFNAGGRVLPVEQRGYANLTSVIIPPQQQQQLTIVGPSLSELTEQKGIVGLFLYDVVTQQSEAGVVTEKQNYQWYFDYEMQPRSVEVPATRSQDTHMTQAEWQRLQMTESMEGMPTRRQAYPGYPGPGYPQQPE